MITCLDPGSARVSTYVYLHTITLVDLINNYCYGKSQVRITRDFLFVDLHMVLNSLTPRFFTRKLPISITIRDATKSQIICFTKTEWPLPSNSQFRMKRTQQRVRRQTINKTVTNQNHTKPKRTKTFIWNRAVSHSTHTYTSTRQCPISISLFLTTPLVLPQFFYQLFGLRSLVLPPVIRNG